MEHKGTQEIKTERLLLRRFVIDDYMDMYTWCSNPEVLKYVCYKEHQNPDVSKEILTDWINGYSSKETYNWAIEFNGKVIGNIALSGYDEETACHHLGWQIDSPYWNMGIMTEAVKSVLDYLFDVGFEKLGACCNSKNIGSARVMQKAGMTKTFTIKNVVYKKNGTLYDRDVYAITKTDWLKSNGAKYYKMELE